MNHCTKVKLRMVLQLKLVFITLVCWNILISYDCVVGDSQTSIVLNSGCSTFNASNLRNFYANINGTFLDLKNQISNESKHFATSQQAIGEVIVFSMFQCRNYLSKNDCVGCFNTASTKIRNCSAANGARLIYDGCFLRYVHIEFIDPCKYYVLELFKKFINQTVKFVVNHIKKILGRFKNFGAYTKISKLYLSNTR